MSRKFVKGEYPKEEEDDEEDPDSDGEKSGGFFDPDIFLYGAVQRFAPARMRSLLSVLPSESPELLPVSTIRRASAIQKAQRLRLVVLFQFRLFGQKGRAA